jgi:3-hydroxybutyryl-CoA dehydrogenase
MGGGIAQVAATAGHTVHLFDAAAGAPELAIGTIAKFLDRAVEKGQMDPARRAAILARISPTRKIEDCAEAMLVIEAVGEDIEIKRKLFAALEALVAPAAILASNTSSLSIAAIARGLRQPARVVGMHFFNPAPILPLVEVVSAPGTAPEVSQCVYDTARAWGKMPVHCRSTPGFIVNRCARPFYGEALRLLGERASDPATLDAIMREAGGFRMGPCELMDLIGIDVNFAVTKSVHAAYSGDPRYQPSLVQQELIEAGHLGRKTGRGFFDYSPGAPRATARSEPPAAAPRRVVIEGNLGPAEDLVARLARSGIAHTRADSRDGDGVIVLDDADLALTDGRTATGRAAGRRRNLVLFDLALDYGSAKRIAVASADQAAPEARAAAVGFFQMLGIQVSVIDDAPGLVVMRTVAMLANEAMEAVQWGVASAGDIDLAMMNGVNYPLGPLAWADAIGLARVLALVDNLAAHYGEDRYRASPRLRRLAIGGKREA